MRRAAGQVAREAHRALRLLSALAVLLLLATGAAAFRLSQGPIDLPFLATAIADQVNIPGPNGTPPEARFEIHRASIGWQGWREGHLSPVELRLSGVRMVEPGGAVRMELPDAAVSLSLPWLLRGQLAPRQLELQQPVLTLRRDAAGDVSLLLGETGGSATGADADLDRILADLLRPPSDRTPLSALQSLRILGGRIVVEDAALGLTWVLDEADVTLRRRLGGGLIGNAVATLLLGGERVPVTLGAELDAAADAGPAQLSLRLLLPELRPMLLAQAAPALAPLARLDATARIEARARLDTRGKFQGLHALLTTGPGALELGEGRRIALSRLELDLEAAPDRVTIPRALLRLDGDAAPSLTVQAAAARAGEAWQGEATLGLDQMPIAELSRRWPEGLAPHVRSWIVQNLTAGTARDGRWRIAVEAGPGLAAARITSLEGTLEVAEATVHWLRPIPPAERATGTVTFGLEEIGMRITGGRQSGGTVTVRDGSIRFLLPPGAQETAQMEFNLAGPIPDALAVVQHPRLRLFERQPFPVKDPRGSMEARLNIAFPLLSDLPVEQLQLRVQARLRQVQIADVLLGRPLERGTVELTVDNNGLRASGTATLAEIAARLTVEMDFRNGPPGQVVMRETVLAETDARNLVALGLAFPEVVQGQVGLDVRTERRRNGQGRATVRADLRQARLMIDPLAWSKPPGQNAGGDMVLRLAGENLTAIESFRIEGPSMRLRGSASFTSGTRLERVAVTEGVVEDSRFTGEARPPLEPGGPWALTLRGQVLDLRRMLSEDASGAAAATPDNETSPAFAADARFERVLLGPSRELAAVTAQLRVDGRGVVRAGTLAGRAGPRGAFQAQIAPAGAGRSLRLEAEDAGALLGSFDVLRRLEGGRLSVQGTYASNRPGAPLSGTAEMSDFAIRGAPAVAKLLQAMTLYGLMEAASGPGLGFSRLIAPFNLTPDVLALGEARAFSASLGVTLTGTLDRRRQRLDMAGTIVPAYFFNSLLGNIPILGRLFAPEAGGGLFAATFRVSGPADDPAVNVNPLAALTPGFLRGLFGIGQQATP
ncbi:AsmA-like C-terminal region-containing protein [Falsiroseomonas sp.]|uniref:YhdP family protein n=1 Tax=Falsiroseomonas sp. TaxID=2870721 RepID=UPI00271C24E1|nr:AsmA-like C-terminal region-containing protein [Falsiroseomonas sp.]MDO9501031.1 AsmA-like C-terminal region-containing protein [Falsiroseomonas sp.]